MIVNFDNLADSDSRVIGEALHAAAEGPFFPDWEFRALFGLERSEVRAISDAWPNRQAPPADVTIAVNNSLNNLLGYPHGQDSVWSHWMSANRDQLQNLFDRLRKAKQERYFDRVM